MAKQKKSIKKGKKPHKNKPTSQKWKFYKIQNEDVSRGKYCPRCGPGVFLATSKSGDKLYCGKCHYTEFLKKDKSNEKEN